ncbi:MFS transporter [Stieleria varia]|uniref:Major Facilitator Superfamily protein n=1 Tax=Stieleria varia TaxID=2528005 RepID=A0A5C6A383_9BACT|nr:MFS transporter [Stieleria varia]TWT93999.1 Major Facilitator Superfamily protein [Stieleria varia]
MTEIAPAETGGQWSGDRSKANRSDVRHNLLYSMGDASSFGAMVGMGETYFPAFALAVGMSEASAGLVASLPIISGGLMQLLSLHLMKYFRSEQSWVVLCAGIQAAAFIPLILVAASGGVTMPILLAIASLYWASGLASGPAWNTWMDSIVPTAVRPKYFSRRSRLQQASTFTALIGSGLLLHFAQTGDWVLQGFAILFVLAGIFRIISTVCLARHRTDPRLARRATGRGQTNHSGSVTRTGRRLLVYLIVVQACVQISGPFFAPYMLKSLELSYFQYVFLMSVGFMSRIIAMSRWTAIASGYGASTLLWIGAIGLIPLSSLWILSSNMIWLAMVQACSGVAWAAYELGFFLLFFETLPAGKRTKMLTYYNFGNTVAMFAGASLGAFLLGWLGSNQQAYYWLFGVSSLGRLFAIGLLFRTKLRPAPVHQFAIRVLGIRPTSAIFDVPILSSFRNTKRPAVKEASDEARA